MDSVTTTPETANTAILEGLDREGLRQRFFKDKSHHLPNGRFTNPWPSFSVPSMPTLLYNFLFVADNKPVKKSIAEGRVPQVVPLDEAKISNPSGVQMSWLGHASLLVQIDGATILCDPVFSERCSPSQWFGPKRYTKPACQVDDLPHVDVLIISHNHYDHLDWNTLTQVAKKYPDIRVFSTLGNRPILESIGFKNVTIGDWWEEFDITLPNNNGQFKFACTPAQHMTARGVLDRMATLWSSWVIQGPSGRKFFFSGDTAYSSTYKNEDKAECPAFKQIGQVYGPIDLSAIAIGAYGPEIMFSGMHVNPEQAVRIHEDIGSKKSIGIHWGTFVLTSEPADEPPQRLKAAMEARGHLTDEFTVLSIGETVQVD
ncbi:Protein-lysine N-methyltransferase efm4 [Coemansia sp. RSA 2703]|nr:Protein-lysine N-methyltransferase efm4 [Coemansia sp. RSA 2703]KAJ2370357.1 Protein-lysine N-methyltransferase efm4 [Coemansia sp. RSA 2607]KAJ2392827.1 Protein-lysine N-methyltransferase efm4 [Coemansia sp. RSA 2603]